MAGVDGLHSCGEPVKPHQCCCTVCIKLRSLLQAESLSDCAVLLCTRHLCWVRLLVCSAAVMSCMPVSVGARAVKALAYKPSRLHCGYTVGHTWPVWQRTVCPMVICSLRLMLLRHADAQDTRVKLVGICAEQMQSC